MKIMVALAPVVPDHTQPGKQAQPVALSTEASVCSPWGVLGGKGGLQN